MPNWVVNRLSFKKAEDLIKIINKYCVVLTNKGKEETTLLNIKMLDDLNALGDVQFDFDKVLPMPAVLNIPESTSSSCCLHLYNKFKEMGVTVDLETLTATSVSLYLKQVYDYNYDTWDKLFAPILHATTKKSIGEYMSNAAVANAMPITKAIFNDNGFAELGVYSEDYSGTTFVNLQPAERCRVFIFAYELGRLMSDSIEKYGASTWYSWRCENWGTKWNANETYISIGDLFIEFKTAWNTPCGIFSALAEQNSDILFSVCWSDEDFGYNVGTGQATDGQYTMEYYDNASKIAYETAAELWGVTLEEEGYKWSEEKGTYVYT